MTSGEHATISPMRNAMHVANGALHCRQGGRLHAFHATIWQLVISSAMQVGLTPWC